MYACPPVDGQSGAQYSCGSMASLHGILLSYVGALRNTAGWISLLHCFLALTALSNPLHASICGVCP